MKTKLGKIKTSILITVAVGISVALGILVLFSISNNNMMNSLKNTAENNMEAVLQAKKVAMNDYIEETNNLMVAFSNSPVLTDFLKNRDSEEAWRKAMDYNIKFYSDLDSWEAVYLCDWNSEVLTHITENPLGMILRKDEDALNGLRNSILGAEKVYTSGILVSPASGKLMLSMYYAVRDPETNEPIGFVGGGALPLP